MIIPEEHDLLQTFKIEATKHEAFNKIMQLYQERIYFFIRRMVLDHDDANDIAQNTFLKAWKGLENFRSDSKLSTWLTRIAYNESIDFISRRKRISGIPLDQIEHVLESKLAADVYYDGDEIQRKLQVALAQLPEKQKAVFVMKYYEEKKYEEIAEITGTSVGALKASYHHAVGKLKNYLTPD